MYLIFQCPCCSSQNITLFPSHIAQFVVVRSTGFPLKQNLPSLALECHNCSFICSALRLSGNELENYYKDYNEESFYQHRIKFDSYYVGLPEYYKTEEFYNLRMRNINLILQRQPYLKNIKNILDYGGNTGLYFPVSLDKAEKFLYDVNVKQLPDGITRIDKTSNQKFDFIMCCHVLEHLSDPGSLLEEILNFSHDETIFYIETPNGDLEMGGRMKPNMGFHEHINLFNLKSMTALMNRYGLTVIDSSFEHNFLGILCTKQYNITKRED